MPDFDHTHGSVASQRIGARSRPGHALSVGSVAAFVCVAGLLVACGGSGGRNQPRDAAATPTADPLRVLPDGRAWWASEAATAGSARSLPASAQLGTGERISVDCRWVGVQGLEGSAESGRRNWSGQPVVDWNVADAPARADEFGFWACRAIVPVRTLDAAPNRARTLRHADDTFRLLRLEPGAMDLPASRRLPAESVWARESLAGLASNPGWRWRAGLARTSVGWPVETQEQPWPEAVEEIARLEEWSWAAALDRLNTADPALARELRDALGGVVEFPGGVAVPIWTGDSTDVRRLMLDLLEESQSAEGLRRSAREFLTGQPRLLAWVSDDAGANDAITGAPVATVWIANLSGREAVVSLAAAQRSGDAAGAMGSEKRTMTPVPAWSARTAAVATEPGAVGFGARAGVLLESGVWRAERAVLAPISARPPGVNVGPLLMDWTMPSLAGTASAIEIAGGNAAQAGLIPTPEWMTAARLYRSGDLEPSGEASSRDERSMALGWMLYIECRGNAEADAGTRHAGAGRESVTVWLGGLGAPSAVVEVVPDGSARDLRGEGVRKVRVARSPTGWSCWLPVPAAAVEFPEAADRGVLRVGLVRTDSRGVRSAWPRPMLPWQREPGRAVVDVGSWNATGR